MFSVFWNFPYRFVEGVFFADKIPYQIRLSSNVE